MVGVIQKNLELIEVYGDEDIRTMNFSEILDLLNVIEYLLGLDKEDQNDNIFNVMKEHYEASGMNIHPGAQMFSKMYSVLTTVMGRVHEIISKSGQNILHEKCRDIMNKEMTFSERWNRDRTMLHYLDQFTKSHTMFRHCHKNNGSYAEDSTDIWSMDPYDPSNLDGCNDFQLALFSVLRTIWENRYARYKTNICEEIKTKDGYKTRAWKVISSIEEFVYGVVKKEHQIDLWKKITRQGGTIKSIANLLEKQKDLQFPDIKKCRHLWSFNNGLLYAKEWNPEKGMFVCKFYPYGSAQCFHLDPTLVSAKYFDKEFTDHNNIKDWYNIPTPNFQHILDYQKFPERQARWMYILAGRLCFATGDLDRWQVIPFLKGIAKSGKSTLLTKVFKKFYDTEDVRVMSNNIEKKFGLQAIYNSFMFIAPEIKHDLSLDQAEFQSIVSGEEVSVPRKNEQAITLEWTSPGVLAGNEVPNWRDNSGSIMRRIVPFDFMQQVKEADTDLEIRLDVELPSILEKCLRAYTETVVTTGKKDIWKVVPLELTQAQTQMASATNVLCEFLSSSNMMFGAEEMVPFKTFRTEFYRFCDEVNRKRPHRFTPTNKEFWIGPFSNQSLEVERIKGEFTYNGKPMRNRDVIKGVNILVEMDMDIM